MSTLKKFNFYISFLMLLLVASGCESRKIIVNGLDEREANEVIVFLSGKGIDATKIQAKSEAPGGGGGGPALFDIYVDGDKVTESLALLNANGLPRRRPERLLELFTQGGLVPSEMQDKIRYQQGLAAQIGAMIRKIDGILDAEVQLSFPEEDPLNPGKSNGAVTASVFVKHNGVLDDPNSHLITKIRRLVASSVQGLNFENVTVISDKGRFSEANAQKVKSNQGNVDLTRVWTIVLAQESITRFQVIFFTLTILCCLFVFTTAWLAWKLFPIAAHHGGISRIFSIHPIEVFEKEPEEKSESADKPEEKKEDEKGPKVQENIESM